MYNASFTNMAVSVISAELLALTISEVMFLYHDVLLLIYWIKYSLCLYNNN